ncbi:hypothetical protein MHYP_G00013370 [Metynnis hypsauchen]
MNRYSIFVESLHKVTATLCPTQCRCELRLRASRPRALRSGPEPLKRSGARAAVTPQNGGSADFSDALYDKTTTLPVPLAESEHPGPQEAARHSLGRQTATCLMLRLRAVRPGESKHSCEVHLLCRAREDQSLSTRLKVELSCASLSHQQNDLQQPV